MALCVTEDVHWLDWIYAKRPINSKYPRMWPITSSVQGSNADATHTHTQTHSHPSWLWGLWVRVRSSRRTSCDGITCVRRGGSQEMTGCLGGDAARLLSDISERTYSFLHLSMCVSICDAPLMFHNTIEIPYGMVLDAILLCIISVWTTWSQVAVMVYVGQWSWKTPLLTCLYFGHLKHLWKIGNMVDFV